MQLIHQVLFVLQPPGCVGNQDIHVSCPCRRQSVIHHGCAVSTGVLGNHRNLIALTPDLQLLHGGRPKGIPRCQHDRLPFRLELLRQLADGGGLAHTIDTHHQNHERAAGPGVQWHLNRLENPGQGGAQMTVNGVRISGFPASDQTRQLRQDFAGGGHANIRGQQGGFQFFKQLIIQRPGAKEHILYALGKPGPCFPQAVFQPGEQARLAPGGFFRNIR